MVLPMLLMGGCTIIDVEHMSCSFEFLTQKYKKNVEKKLSTDLWPFLDYVFLLLFWALLACKISHRGQIVTKLSEQPDNPTL